MRAPVPTGSVTDLVVRVGRETTAEEVNELFRSKADTGPLEGILRYTDEPLVSTDIQHSSYSSIFDSQLTMAGGTLVKVFGWYDNEWGYSCRLVDLVAKVGATLPAAPNPAAIAHLPATAHVAVIGHHTLPFVLALLRQGCESVRSLRPGSPNPDCEPVDLAWIVDLQDERELDEALRTHGLRTL